MPVNFVMLSVMSGIIGLVVGAFTSWHIMLASRGQTTIECLEKTRYLSPLRKTFNRAHNPANHVPEAAQQFVDFHANALPGVTRPEEGEVDLTRSTNLDGARPVQMSYVEMERQRNQKRYEDYLDEQDSSKLPNAFDLGWRRNLRHLFGPVPWLWAFPVCNTTGDGWAWEASPRWVAERDRLRSEREQQRAREVNAGWGGFDDYSNEPPPIITQINTSGAARHYHPSPPSETGQWTPSKADRILGRDPGLYADSQQAVPMQRLSPRGRTVEQELDEIDREDQDGYDDHDYFGSAGDQSYQNHQSRQEAEAQAMNVVTNGGWGRGGASGMLKKQHSSNGNTPRPHTQTDDDGVD